MGLFTLNANLVLTKGARLTTLKSSSRLDQMHAGSSQPSSFLSPANASHLTEYLFSVVCPLRGRKSALFCAFSVASNAMCWLPGILSRSSWSLLSCAAGLGAGDPVRQRQKSGPRLSWARAVVGSTCSLSEEQSGLLT